MKYSADNNPEVRQAAVYGIGACAQFGGDYFKPYATSIYIFNLNLLILIECIQQLVAAIQRKDAKEENHLPATCNAVSALYKIAKFQPNAEGVSQEQLLTIWLNSLPVGGDSVEARIVHGNLVDFIQAYEIFFFSYLLIFVEIIQLFLDKETKIFQRSFKYFQIL